MFLLGDDLTKRLRLTLCIGLALLFAFASASRNIDQLQHSPGAFAEHHHVLFGSLSIDNDHAGEDHHLAMAEHDGHDDSDDRGPDHMPGSHHHHHADGGNGFLALSSSAPSLWYTDSASYAAEAAQQIAGLAIRGLERPPKAALTNA
jgi:hypothetical protein